MSAKEIALRYGRGEVKFEIPEEQLLYELRGRNQDPPEDFPAAYLHALYHPIDSPPLPELIKPGDKVVITVSDITRGWQKNADEGRYPVIDRQPTEPPQQHLQRWAAHSLRGAAQRAWAHLWRQPGQPVLSDRRTIHSGYGR